MLQEDINFIEELRREYELELTSYLNKWMSAQIEIYNEWYKKAKHTAWLSAQDVLARAKTIQDNCRHKYQPIEEGSGWFWVDFDGEGERQICIQSTECIYCQKRSFYPYKRVHLYKR